MAEILLAQREITSRRLDNRRTVWMQPARAPTNHACIFLDGEYYFAHVRAAGILNELQESATIPPVTVAYVSCIDHEVRWPESFCNEEFAAFLHEELVPWLRENSGSDGKGVTMLGGVSLTGLSAAHAALLHPTTFSHVLCQSGSFWWNDNWLPSNLPDAGSNALRLRVTVGDKETDEDVDHGKGLVQVESQLAANRQMRKALVDAGHSVSYAEFTGGHDIASWRADLAASLTALWAL